MSRVRPGRISGGDRESNSPDGMSAALVFRQLHAQLPLLSRQSPRHVLSGPASRVFCWRSTPRDLEATDTRAGEARICNARRLLRRLASIRRHLCQGTLQRLIKFSGRYPGGSSRCARDREQSRDDRLNGRPRCGGSPISIHTAPGERIMSLRASITHLRRRSRHYAGALTTDPSVSRASLRRCHRPGRCESLTTSGRLSRIFSA